MKTAVIQLRKQKETTFVDNASGPPQVPIDRYFTEVTRACANLGETERKAIYLRFWQDTKIARIADALGLSWDETNWLIDHAVQKINRTLTRRIHEQSDAVAA